MRTPIAEIVCGGEDRKSGQQLARDLVTSAYELVLANEALKEQQARVEKLAGESIHATRLLKEVVTVDCPKKAFVVRTEVTSQVVTIIFELDDKTKVHVLEFEEEH